MTRVALSMAWMLAALAFSPAGAHARGTATAVEPAICDETSLPVVLSELLVEGRPVAGAEAAPLRQAQEDDAPPAWCLTPDDPRCAPRDASAPLHTQAQLVPLCGYEEGKLPQLRALEPASVPRSVQLGAAMSGIALRVERPPRG
jgi:hypothetical protein